MKSRFVYLSVALFVAISGCCLEDKHEGVAIDEIAPSVLRDSTVRSVYNALENVTKDQSISVVLDSVLRDRLSAAEKLRYDDVLSMYNEDINSRDSVVKVRLHNENTGHPLYDRMGEAITPAIAVTTSIDVLYPDGVRPPFIIEGFEPIEEGYRVHFRSLPIASAGGLYVEVTWANARLSVVVIHTI